MLKKPKKSEFKPKREAFPQQLRADSGVKKTRQRRKRTLVHHRHTGGQPVRVKTPLNVSPAHCRGGGAPGGGGGQGGRGEALGKNRGDRCQSGNLTNSESFRGQENAAEKG